MDKLREFLEKSRSASFKSDKSKTTYINKILKLAEEAYDLDKEADEPEQEDKVPTEDKQYYKRQGLEIVRPNGSKESVGHAVMTSGDSAKVDEANKRVEAKRKAAGGSW